MSGSTPNERDGDLERVFPITVDSNAPSLPDVPAAVREALGASGIEVRAGERIAVAVGSRGVANIREIVAEVVGWVRRQGAEPFVVPAMGSHGGATAAGQEEVLAGYGVTESALGASIRSSMDVVELPRGDAAVPVYMDRTAWSADGVILVNRVKPHTDFHGFPESGLVKMAVIGLGKHEQAKAVHSLGIRGLTTQILPAFRAVLATGRIRGGVACVENDRDRTMIVRAVPGRGIEPTERELLEVARASLARLPVEDLDVLIVDAMGKDVSGTCMDTNVIGRIRIPGETEPASPRIRSIYVRSLTAGSHGNAIGIGLADVISRSLYEQVDFAATYENGITSSFLDRMKIPYAAPNDRIGVGVALRGAALGPHPRPAPRVVRIRHTLDVHHFLASGPVADELRDRAGIEVGPPVPAFGSGDELADW